jgi:hypothetical protein
MAKNKKPNKRYKPKERILPVNIRFNSATEVDLQLIPHQYLALLRTGGFDEPMWHAMAARMNLGNTLAYTYFDEAKAPLDEACKALRSVWDRHTRTEKWGASGEELGWLGDGLNLTDEMQLKCTRRELDSAMEHVYRVAAVDKRLPDSFISSEQP